MIRIHHAPGTRSVRPLWLCHELGLPVEVRTIDFSAAWRASPEWRALSPAGKVPVLEDDGLVMFESGAMVDYLLERYGDGRLRPPPATAASARFRQWCWFAEATLVRPVGVVATLRAGEDGGGVALAAEGRRSMLECLAMVDAEVAGQPWLLASGFSAADVMMGYSCALLAKYGVLDASMPNAWAYLERVRAREAFQRAWSG